MQLLVRRKKWWVSVSCKNLWKFKSHINMMWMENQCCSLRNVQRLVFDHRCLPCQLSWPGLLNFLSSISLQIKKGFVWIGKKPYFLTWNTLTLYFLSYLATRCLDHPVLLLPDLWFRPQHLGCRHCACVSELHSGIHTTAGMWNPTMVPSWGKPASQGSRHQHTHTCDFVCLSLASELLIRNFWVLS